MEKDRKNKTAEEVQYVIDMMKKLGSIDMLRRRRGVRSRS
jgi:hypothetical protein